MKFETFNLDFVLSLVRYTGSQFLKFLKFCDVIDRFGVINKNTQVCQ